MELPEKMPYSLEDLLSCREYDMDRIKKNYQSLVEWKPKEEYKVIGSIVISSYQIRELLKCRRNTKNYQTIYDIYNNNQEDKHWSDVIIRSSKNKTHYPRKQEVIETLTINKGCVAIFKPSISKYIYKKYNAKSVLDPTAGWGGRLLGASSLDIKYTGFDTNTSLKKGYDKMIHDLDLKNVEMIYQDSLSYDFSDLKYDLVLTSPPYYNLELYENMTPFESEDIFYNEFLIPLMNKCFQYLQDGGKMCFNISPEMYMHLMNRGYKECTEKVPLIQKKKNLNDKRQDFIYVWFKEKCV